MLSFVSVVCALSADLCKSPHGYHMHPNSLIQVCSNYLLSQLRDDIIILCNPLNKITLSCVVLELNCQCFVPTVFSAVLQDQYL